MTRDTGQLTSWAIDIESLSYSYKGRRGQRTAALDEVSLRLALGESLALLGPNGSGKSTCLKILSTLIGEFEGQVSVLGMNLKEQTTAARKKLGICFQSNRL